jgi:hypothetical protein
MASPADVARLVAGVSLALLHSVVTNPKQPLPPHTPLPLHSSVDCRCVCDCTPHTISCPVLPLQPLVVTVALMVIVAAACGFRLGRALPVRPLRPASPQQRAAAEESDEEEGTRAVTSAALQAALYGAAAATDEEAITDVQTLATRQAEFLRQRRSRPSRP